MGLDCFVAVYDGLDIGMAGAWMAESEYLSLAPYPEYSVAADMAPDAEFVGMLHG